MKLGTVLLQISNYFNVGTRFQRLLFAREVAINLYAKGLRCDWLRKRINTSRKYAKQSARFGPRCFWCPR